MLIDSASFRKLVDVIARDAPLAASDACRAVKLARLVASLDHDEDPAENDALDTLSWEVCSRASATDPASYVFVPPTDPAECLDRIDSLIHGMTTPAAGELAYAVAYVLIARDPTPAPEVRLLGALRRSLELPRARAEELVELAMAAVADPVN